MSQYNSYIHNFRVLIIIIIMNYREFIFLMRITTRKTPMDNFLINHINRCKGVRDSFLIRGPRLPTLFSSLL
jgi:hypothetical protein